MVRTQIQLTQEQYQGLKALAQGTHEPIAALIRRAVDQLLLTRKPDRAALYRQAASVVGKYTAGAPDIAVEHDRYLEEAYR
ncbi:MAG: ribbon-helix-helix domain-containing protein [Thermodesulfobacteriota bacterium]